MGIHRIRPSEPSIYRDAAFLKSGSVTEIRKWLQEKSAIYSAQRKPSETPDEAPVLEYILLRRNEGQIDLLLAEYGWCQWILKRVYQRSKLSVRVVVCANPAFFVGGGFMVNVQNRYDSVVFWDILQHGSLAELRALCEIPDLTSATYLNLITSWVGNEQSQVPAERRLSDSRFQQVLRFLANNPRLKIPYEQSSEFNDFDGFVGYEYRALFSECWRLAEIVPTDFKWACCLVDIYHAMSPDTKPYEDLESVLERWRPQSSWGAGYFRDLRQILAEYYMTPSPEMLNQEDLEIRLGFYAAFDPHEHGFLDVDWAKWVTRDEGCDIALLSNENIWCTEEARVKLRRVLRDTVENHNLFCIMLFENKEEIHRKEHPEWFLEDDTIEEKSDYIGLKALQDGYAGSLSVVSFQAPYKALQEQETVNDDLGRTVLRADFGDYFYEEPPAYKLNDETRDRLIVHTRQDVGSVFAHAKSAFKTAKGAENAAKRTNRLMWLVIGLLIIGFVI